MEVIKSIVLLIKNIGKKYILVLLTVGGTIPDFWNNWVSPLFKRFLGIEIMITLNGTIVAGVISLFWCVVWTYHELRKHDTKNSEELATIKKKMLHITIRGLSRYSIFEGYLWHITVQFSNSSTLVPIGFKNIWLEKYRDGKLIYKRRPISPQQHTMFKKKDLVPQSVLSENLYLEPNHTLSGELIFWDFSDFNDFMEKDNIKIIVEDSASYFYRDNEWVLCNCEK